MKRLMGLFLLALGWLTSFAAPTIRDMKTTSIAPWGMVIDYTVCGAESGEVEGLLVVTAMDGENTYVAQNLSGDIEYADGVHRIYWNMAKDGITAEIQDGQVKVAYWPLYCVIDLSAGADSATYPISYLGKEPDGGFNTDEYKTTKLVLKRVDAGSFILGASQSDESHRVTLTKPYYMGLFEVTQKQWQLVEGNNPSYFTGEKRPVEKVSYLAVRGSSDWPASSAVGKDSFLGKLRARTGIDFDLPTDAQWEYVCRARTTTQYSYGDTANGDYMWYKGNASGCTHEVGAKKPNPWGFYDMHGNVREWCLDWYVFGADLSYGKDPVGPSSGSYRVTRGGGWYCASDNDYSAQLCASSARFLVIPSDPDYDCGFRLARPLSD